MSILVQTPGGKSLKVDSQKPYTTGQFNRQVKERYPDPDDMVFIFEGQILDDDNADADGFENLSAVRLLRKFVVPQVEGETKWEAKTPAEAAEKEVLAMKWISFAGYSLGGALASIPALGGAAGSMSRVYDTTVSPVTLSRPAMRLLARIILLVMELDVLFTVFTFLTHPPPEKKLPFLGETLKFLNILECTLDLFLLACIHGWACYMPVEHWDAQKELKLFEFVNQTKKQGLAEDLIRNYLKANHTGNVETAFDNDQEIEYVLTLTESSVQHNDAAWFTLYLIFACCIRALLLPLMMGWDHWGVVLHLHIGKKKDAAWQEHFFCGQRTLHQLQRYFNDLQNSIHMKFEHSIPCYRLACFGWQGDLDPMDLAGILNANALYSFTVGIPQLFFTLWSIFHTSEGSAQGNAILFLSLFIGFISLVISVANIAAGFSKRSKELIRKEKKLEKKIQDAPERFNELHGKLVALLDADKSTEINKLLALYEPVVIGKRSCYDDSIKIAKLEEEYENFKKKIFQPVESIHSTEQRTTIFRRPALNMTAAITKDLKEHFYSLASVSAGTCIRAAAPNEATRESASSLIKRLLPFQDFPV